MVEPNKLGLRGLQHDLINKVFGAYIEKVEERSDEDQEELYLVALELSALLGKDLASSLSWEESASLLNKTPFNADSFMAKVLHRFSPSVFIPDPNPTIH